MPRPQPSKLPGTRHPFSLASVLAGGSGAPAEASVIAKSTGLSHAFSVRGRRG